jgi:hypothetical protein
VLLFDPTGSHIENGLGMLLYDPEEHPSAAFWLAASLLPIAESADTDPHQRCKSRLAQAVFLTKASDIKLFKMKQTRRGSLTTKDFSPLTNALKELIKQFLFHGYSLSTSNRRALL